MVYLIHFEEKLKHAQHYIGFVQRDLEQRIKKHKRGDGARLLRAVNAAGIKWSVVRVWEDGDRTFERLLKKRKNTKCICPKCNVALEHLLHGSVSLSCSPSLSKK